MNKFFVYGTLMKGFSNHAVIDKDWIENIEDARIKNVELFMHPYADFPCLINGNEEVLGELITIKEPFLTKAIHKMDRLEGFYEENYSKNLYNREVRQILLKRNEKTKAYVYFFNLNGTNKLGRKIKSGSYKEFKKQAGEYYEC